jgi:tRNA threonylcarbamoyladenosine biosynthesis protein TsaB
MKILSLECSATPASVAIIENGKLVASSFVNVRLTHSQTLMPMVENTLKSAMLSITDIDGFSISNGPGSFTGVRIGISAVKGLAAPKNTPCVAVSTLRAMAQNFIDTNCYVCAVMDARCNQVYNALFDITDGKITRLCEDRALMCDELVKELETLSENGKDIIITGDGTDIFFPLAQNVQNVKKSQPRNRYQNAVGVGLVALSDFENGNTVSSEELLPLYLRLPQAERELKEKREKKL